MKNRENGMIDLSSQIDPDLSGKPLFIKPATLIVWFLIIGGIVAIAIRLYFWYSAKS